MKFQDFFRGYTGSHGVSVPTDEIDQRGKRKHRHFTKTGSPTEAEWSGHLSGEGSGVGVIPLLDDNRNVYWGAIDIDKYPLDHLALERDVRGLPLVVTQSKSGGAHLWIFCREPVPAKVIIEKLTEWASLLGFGGSEVFPKQHSRLVGKDDHGNWINLPYYGDTRKCVHEGEIVELETFLQIAEANSVNLEQLQQMNVAVREDASRPFSDGPSCLEQLHIGGIAEGGRNNTLFNIGLYFKFKDPENWKEAMKAWNEEHISPPLEPNEVKDSIRTLERKNYNYTCSKHPLNSHCNRPLCVKREFGIARGSNSDELNVLLSGLTKIDTTEPRWLINIDGVRAEIPDTSVLLDQKKFGIIVVDRVHKVFQPVAAKKWNEEIQKLLNTVEVVEAPSEASPEGQFDVHLQTYLEIRKGPNKDSIVSGRAWHCEVCNRAYFRSTDLFSYLKREGFRDLKMNQMFGLLHEKGLKKGRWNVKGTQVAYWSVPLDPQQTEPFDVPTFGEDINASKQNGAQDERVSEVTAEEQRGVEPAASDEHPPDDGGDGEKWEM